MIALIGWLGCQVDSVLGAVLENRGLMTKGTVNAAAIAFGIIAMCSGISDSHSYDVGSSTQSAWV